MKVKTPVQQKTSRWNGPHAAVTGKWEILCRGGTSRKKSAFRSFSTSSQPRNEIISFPLKPLQIRFRLLQFRQKPSRRAERVSETALSGKLTVLQLTAQTCTGSSSAGCAAGRFSWPLAGAAAAISTQKEHTAKEKVKALCPTAEILCRRKRGESKTCPNTSFRPHLRQASCLFFKRLDFGGPRRKLLRG